MTMKTWQLKNLWDAAKAHSKREVYSNTILPQKQEKHRIANLTLYLKQLEKEPNTHTHTKISRRKGITQIRAEINEKEMNGTIVKFNKTKSCFFEKINKIDKQLARHIKKKREKNQINKYRN